MASSPSPESHPPLHCSPQQLGSPENKELLAPAGWQKKIASTKRGGTPRRGAVYFITPDGEEIKSKRTLEGYLKSHPGGPSVTEFDWSTGETPRRSSRLSTKTPPDSPESGPGRKRVRRKVALEDESPQYKERVGLEGALPAKADEVMEDIAKVKECEAVEKMESDINEEVEKVAEKTDEHKILECVAEAETEMAQTLECEAVERVEPVEKMQSNINEEVEKIAEKTDEHKILECVAEAETEMAQTVECEAVERVKPVEKMESDINEEVEKIAEKTDEHKILECVAEVGTEMAQTLECEAVERVEPVEKMESINEEVEKIAEKTDEHKILECVAEAETEMAQTVECEAVERVEPVEKMESDINEEVEKITEMRDKHKILEFVSEAEAKMAQTVERFSEDGEGKGADAREELIEFRGEKVQTEEGIAEKLQNKVEETPVIEVSEVVQFGGEVANNGKIGTFEEHKQEDSEKETNGVSQLSEAPEASRCLNVSKC